MSEHVTSIGINPMAAENIIRWRFSPEKFAREMLGFIPSNQQEEYFRELARLVRAKYKLAENATRQLMRKPEIEMDQLDRDYSEKMGISIMAGKGSGKDAVLAVTIAWALTCFDRVKIPITGPSYDQLKDVIMPEISKWLDVRDENGKPRTPLKEIIEVKSETVLRRDADKTLRAFGHIRTVTPGSNEKQQEAVLGGWHEDQLVAIIDEASGVPEGVFKALETTLTRPFNFAIVCFNPSRNEGFAYETHFGKRASKWIQLQWDSRKSSLVDKQQLQNMLDLYGADGPEYRVYVLGLPPENESDALIQRAWVISAQDRYSMTWKAGPDDPVIMGVDSARGGKDESVILTRCGRRVVDVFRVNKKLDVDSVQLADQVLMKIAEHDPHVVLFDSIGIGGPVYDIVRRHYSKCRAVDVGKAATKDKFGRLRDELWWSLRERFEKGLLDIPEDAILRNELCSVKWKANNKGQTKIESKEEMKRRNMPSPNRADALMLTMAVSERALVSTVRESDRDAYDEPEPRSRGAAGRAWMNG